MQSREPKSIRFTELEWEAIKRAGRRRGLEPAVCARMLAMYALIIVEAPSFAEASAWLFEFAPQMLGESPTAANGTTGSAGSPSPHSGKRRF